MNNNKETEREALIKELSTNYNYSNKDISQILKDKGFKMNIRLLASQIKYFRWNAIIESLEQDGFKINEKSINLIDNYLNEYPNCWRTLAVRNSCS